MTEPIFPPDIAAALDRFDVPPLPDGFTDRLLARIDALAAQPALPPLRPHRSAGGRWRRNGMIAGSFGLFGMVTAAAAATGFFGEPVYVPVVSEALAEANIAPLPKKLVKKPEPVAKKPRLPEQAAPNVIEKDVVAATGVDAARALMKAKWQDPAFRQMPKEERKQQMRESLSKAMADGQFSKEELKTAAREWRAERAERQQQRAAARAAFGLPERPGPHARQTPAGTAPTDEAANPPLVETERAKMRPRLREKLDNATPEEREHILAEIRARRESRREARRAAKAVEVEAGLATDPSLPQAPSETVAQPPK
jgi:hypothetical protein